MWGDVGRHAEAVAGPVTQHDRHAHSTTWRRQYTHTSIPPHASRVRLGVHWEVAVTVA